MSHRSVVNTGLVVLLCKWCAITCAWNNADGLVDGVLNWTRRQWTPLVRCTSTVTLRRSALAVRTATPSWCSRPTTVARVSAGACEPTSASSVATRTCCRWWTDGAPDERAAMSTWSSPTLTTSDRVMLSSRAICRPATSASQVPLHSLTISIYCVICVVLSLAIFARSAGWLH